MYYGLDRQCTCIIYYLVALRGGPPGRFKCLPKRLPTSHTPPHLAPFRMQGARGQPATACSEEHVHQEHLVEQGQTQANWMRDRQTLLCNLVSFLIGQSSILGGDGLRCTVSEFINVLPIVRLHLLVEDLGKVHADIL